MSIFYSLHGKFDLQFTKSNVQFIVQKAFDIGFTYMAVENFDITNRILNIDEATLQLLTITEEIKDDGGPSIYGKFQDTGISIGIYENNNAIGISFGSFCYQWNKDFNNGSRIFIIDFTRYIRLMFQICKDLTLLNLKTFTDSLDNIIYEDNDCITAVLDIGFLGQKESGYIDVGKLSMESFLCNAIQNRFTLFDEHFKNKIQPSAQEYYNFFKLDFPVFLYAKKNDVIFKIEIKKNIQGYDFVSVYPIKPYLMKKGYGSEKEKIDLAFYVQRLLELCENFAIYELKTFF